MDQYTATQTIAQAMDMPNLLERRMALQALTRDHVVALVETLATTRPHLYRDSAMAYRAIRLQAEPEPWDIQPVDWENAPGYVAYYGGGALAWYPRQLGQQEIAYRYLTAFFNAIWPRDYAAFVAAGAGSPAPLAPHDDAHVTPAGVGGEVQP